MQRSMRSRHLCSLCHAVNDLDALLSHMNSRTMQSQTELWQHNEVDVLRFVRGEVKSCKHAHASQPPPLAD